MSKKIIDLTNNLEKSKLIMRAAHKAIIRIAEKERREKGNA